MLPIEIRSKRAEIITLRAIALKHLNLKEVKALNEAEIITLRAIALKHDATEAKLRDAASRDHNATSYSTETR